jgi:FkbM family methyltransferase
MKKFSTIVETVKQDCIYDLLKYMNLELCVDIGAGAGYFTKIISLSSSDIHIVAYEPFPGNHAFFYEHTKELSNIVLIKKAVSDTVDKLDFFVHSTVQGTEAGWEQYKGYSSVGFLSCVSKIKEEHYPNGKKFRVDTVTLDSEFVDRHISFLKIDVQGAETKVLLGAKQLLHKNKIDVLYIEWSGESEIIDILTNNNYVIYDSTYMVVPNVYGITPFEAMGFGSIKKLQLSTGKIAYDMILEEHGLSPSEAISKVKEQKLGYIQTDIIAVSQTYHDTFLNAVIAYNKA